MTKTPPSAPDTPSSSETSTPATPETASFAGPSAPPPPTQEGSSSGEDLVRSATAGGKALLRSFWTGAKIKVVLFFLLAPLTLAWLSFKFVILPMVASQGLAVWAEGQNMDLTVEDWSADVLDLSARAEGFVLVAPGPYSQQEFLTADALEVDLSLWSGLFKDQWIREVRVIDPKLYLERLAAGRWNWADVADFRLEPEVAASLVDPGAYGQGGASDTMRAGNPPADDDSGSSEGSFKLPRLVLDGMAVQWVETLPGNSGGGVIQDVKASLYVDDVHLTLTDLAGLVDPRPEPTRLSFEARTGNGKISFEGRGNFFSWSLDPGAPGGPGANGMQLAAADFQRPAWAPSLAGKIYLENIEAGAFARLTPNAAIVPERGTLSGTMELASRRGGIECVANVSLRDVTFAVNPSSPLVNNARRESMERDLADYRANGQYQFSCGGELGAERFRPFQAFHTEVVRHGVGEAPRTVRAVAAMDHSQYSEDPIEEELHGEVAAISRDLPPEMRGWYRLSVEILELLNSRPVREARGVLDRFRRRF